MADVQIHGKPESGQYVQFVRRLSPRPKRTALENTEHQAGGLHAQLVDSIH